MKLAQCVYCLINECWPSQVFLTASVEGWVCKRTDLEVNYGFGE